MLVQYKKDYEIERERERESKREKVLESGGWINEIQRKEVNE